MREFDLIRWIRQRAARDERVVVGIGDDAAVVRSPDAPLLFSTDILLDGVHFDLAEATPRQVGWMALACSVSDIAAMGGRSTVAVVAAALPPGFTEADAHELVLGMLDCAEEFGLRLVGGDVTATRGPLAVSVAILGEPVDEPVLRSGAQVGDAILVTGELGGSRLGKHLTFRPRQDEAVALAKACNLHAMIDISDGLARDLAVRGDLAYVAEGLAGVGIYLLPTGSSEDRPVELGAVLSDGLAVAVHVSPGCVTPDRVRGTASPPMLRLTSWARTPSVRASWK